MTSSGFTAAYQGHPPWEIGHAQPAVVSLADDGRVAGRVLDVACGTGENALHLASLGHTVLGIDGVRAAVERAQAKAEQRGLSAEFIVADAFQLAALDRRFDTVLDSAFLHTLDSPATRHAYVDQLAAVVASGGSVHLLQISEHAAWQFPSLTAAEIVDGFGDGWAVTEVRQARYEITTGEVAAWLVSVRRR